MRARPRGYLGEEQLLGKDPLQAAEPGQAVFLGHAGLALDEGQDVVDELLLHAVAGLVDPLAGDLLLEVGHDVQGLQGGLAGVAALAGALEGHHFVGDALHGGVDGGGAGLLITQIIGVAAVAVWAGVTITIVFQIIKHTIGLRVSEAEEIMGLDKPEHGLASAYADFMPVVPNVLGTRAAEEAAAAMSAPAAVEQAVPVTRVTTESTDHKLTKVVIVTKQSRFEVLKEALAAIGVSGMTVTNVIGCGVQHGAAEYYRGAQVDTTLLPKIKMEVVVSKVPVETVVDTVKKVLYTGHIGDGKIFVYDVENVIKVRTGAEGFDALQDDE